MTLATIATGFVAGLIHVFSGPDHLAAIAPLSVEQKKRAWVVGGRWGLGHASGVAFVGIAAIVCRGVLPIDWVSSWAERLVGLVLIAIGIWGLRKAFQYRVHTHTHIHGTEGTSHTHIHVHSPQRFGEHGHTHTAFAIGTLHGIAGSSHFLGILPALALPSTDQAIMYIGSYGAGTVLAMGLFASIVGSAATFFETSGTIIYRSLMSVCSLGAIAVGCYWITTQL